MKKNFKTNKKNILGNNSGFTLVEVLISLLIISLLMVGLYSLIIISLRVTADNAYTVEATEIANQRMEIIRNMRYDDVGTLTGSPHGIIQEYETIERNGLYNVHTMVVFYDDPYDGTLASGTDSVFVDYKIVTIDVNWQGRFGPKKISVFSKIVPNTQETLSGYGLLKLITVDASGAVMPNASIHIENTSQFISADYISNINGQLDLPLLPDFEGYEVTVSKAGYTTEKTYARDSTNLNPTKPNLSVYESVKTEESFSIDKLANFTIRTVSNTLPDNWRVNTAVATDSLYPKISIDQNDNLYFVWQNNSPSASAVYVQKYNSANTKQWPSDLTVSDTSLQANPDIATANSGLSYVVWQDDSVSLKQLALNTSGYIQKIAKSNFYDSPPNNEISGKKTASIFSKIKNFFKSLIAMGFREIKIQKADALTSVSIVQTKISSAINSDNEITATFNSNPTAGNVIIAIAVHRHADHSFSAPTNSAGTFTVSKYSNSGWELDTGVWHKIVAAGEPKSVTITSNGDINGGVLMLMEVSGLDVANLLNVTALNDQTGNSGTTASTGQTAVSTNNGFAVAASAFADDDFNNPDNSNWSSGSSSIWTHRLWTDWSTGNDGSLAVATMDINTAAQQSASLTLSGGGSEERNSLIVVFRAMPLNQAVVSSSGSQNAISVMPLSNYYVGGKFVIIENNSSRNINSVKLQEYGTVNASSKISDIRLYYDLDTSAPYDCASESYNPGTDAQFGSSTTFDGADGFAQFIQAGGVNITTAKTLCLYPVMNISDANNNDILEIRINNPSTDIIVSSGNAIPSTPIEISGQTVLKSPADIKQAHARLRNDDGNETDATWKNDQDQAGVMYINEKLRLRFEMTNSGGISSAAMAFRLEYGEYANGCDSVAAWHAVPSDNSLDWEMIDSANIIDSTPTTNIANGLTDENLSFLPSQIKDTGNQTGQLALSPENFTEMEFSIKPNSGTGDKIYCFRLTDQGSASSINYEKYAVISVKGDKNIYMRAINTNGNFTWPAKKVNADMSDAQQINPVIALTENLGIATTSVAWEDDRNGNSDIYLQILDSSGSRKLATDLRVSTSINNDYSPALAFDSNGNLYVAWVNNDASQDIYLSKFDSGGNLLLGPIALKAGTNQEYYPKIKFDDSDNLFLTYTEEIGGIKKAVVVKYDASLTQMWEKNPNAESMASNQYACRLALYGSSIFAIWNDERNGDKDIYAQKLDASGNLSWEKDAKINIGLDNGDQIWPAIALKSNLRAIGVWQDNRNGLNEIYAAEFTDPESLTGIPNVSLKITGTKRIGENPVIYKYDEVQTTDAGGYLHLNLDWDVPGYSVSIYEASSSEKIILRDPPQPLNFEPGEDKTMIIYVE